MLKLISGLIMFFCGLVVLCSKRKHLLLMLLSLEFVVLSLYFMIMIMMENYSYEFFFSMVFLTMSVCEGALGLSILVSMVRTHGNDYFQSFNILW
uniref:NADH-ubiquinone oxidoreductase chain 4L n=1 Tax=Coomaniella copipes TaxID=2936727 RepID=A0A8T9W0S3_9COLE|nr:NADH dehydrogenase subunit 4L [Coomaniella copipes]UPI13480.1 NADH dehydrogenase subunit 4L [Coomaniella copipes]